MTEAENANGSLNPQINDRTIRVFISSTFRDMQDERDILIKKIFPQLRKLCEERAVTWTEVDLRWGITTEQAAEGKVLPLCLEEIQRCKPYFIGLLGERYGWVPGPNSIPLDLFKSNPWLKEHLQQSVTELEILHGVFDEKPMHGHAYFYFRDPDYLNSLPIDRRQDFTTENTEAAKKIEKLKQQIRIASEEQVCKLRENYKNPGQLGEWILEDFTKLIERLYPKGQTPNPFDLEAARHEAFAKSHRLAFIGREDLLHRLDDYASLGGKPIILTGESGCGKSALLAEWVARWRKNQPNDLVIQHYMGATRDSTDWQNLIRRILGELKRAFGIIDNIPMLPGALLEALSEWTTKATGLRKVVLALDALNQITDEGAGRHLGWLPVEFPPNFRVVVSTLSAESLDALNKRNWMALTVPLFKISDIAPAALAYFGIFSKIPSTEILEKLKSAPAACNPLYLRAVLDELRQFGIYEQLQAKADEYLSAPDLPELFDRILTRWQNDFGKDIDHPDLVRRSLSLIACARLGLSEVELLDLLGAPFLYTEGQVTFADFTSFVPLGSNLNSNLNTPLPHAKWTPFYLAAESALTQSSGLLNFGHDCLRSAVQKRFLSYPEFGRFNHQTIAKYFWNIEVCRRTVDELTWQFKQLNEWIDLRTSLVSPNLFIEACLANKQFEWMQYWQDVRRMATKTSLPGISEFKIDIPDLYHQVFSRLNDKEKLLIFGSLGEFLIELGFPEAAKDYFAEQVHLIKKHDSLKINPEFSALLAANLNDQARILIDQGNPSGAIDLLEQAEVFLKKQSSNPKVDSGLATLFMNKGNAFRDIGDFSAAQKILDRALVLMKEARGEQSIEAATVMQAKGSTSLIMEDFKDAFSWQKQGYLIRREKLGDDHRDTALSLFNMATTLFSMLHFYIGEKLLVKSTEIFRRILGYDHYSTRTAITLLNDFTKDNEKAMDIQEPFGLVLLVSELMPPNEAGPNPRTPEGRSLIVNAIKNNLIAVWDDMLTYESAIPIMIVSCPEYEECVEIALSSDIANKFRTKLLQMLKITQIVNISPEAFLSLFDHRNKFVSWTDENRLKVIMVKPLANIGSPLDRTLLNFMLRKQSPPENIPQPIVKDNAQAPKDIRPLFIEAVPFDHHDGPLTGLHKGDGDPRPRVIPTAVWKTQNYKPQSGDYRATGTFYVNLPAARFYQGGISDEHVTALDMWSTEPLLDIATSERNQQMTVFEQALSDLMLVLMAGQINFPEERGRRGFQRDELSEIDSLYVDDEI